MITRPRDRADEAEAQMRAQILAFLEEHCRNMTLRDVREWFVDAGRSDSSYSEP